MPSYHKVNSDDFYLKKPAPSISDILLPKTTDKQFKLMFLRTMIVAIITTYLLYVDRGNVHSNLSSGPPMTHEFFSEALTITESFYLYLIILLTSMAFIPIWLYQNRSYNTNIKQNIETLTYLYSLYFAAFMIGFGLLRVTDQHMVIYRGFLDYRYPHDFILFAMLGLLLLFFILLIVSYLINSYTGKTFIYTRIARKHMPNLLILNTTSIFGIALIKLFS